MFNFVNMWNHFNLGSGRVSFAHKKDSVYKIEIYEIGSDNGYGDFSIVRWASFVRAIDEAHTNPQLKFRHHIGGGYYISVSANFKCVDIR